jgi:integrase
MATHILTQEFIDRELQCPADKRRIELCDSQHPGLYIEVRETAPGEGTYSLRHKVQGKTRHEKLGRTGEIPLAEARRRAQNRRVELLAARDEPQGGMATTTRATAMTLTEFFDGKYLPHVKPRKRSWDRDEELFRLRIRAAFGSKRLTEINRHDVQAFHTAVLSEGLSPASADHHLKLLRRMLNLAVEWDLLEKNPIAGIKLFNADNKIERYMNDEEIQRLLEVLRTDDNRPVCRIALFLLSTGCRLSEALGATWVHIDRANRVWRIPASTSKSKRVRSVPLNDTALEVLGETGTEGRFAYVFVNERTGKPYVGIMKVWSRLRGEAGLERVRIHDLRHQYASFLVNAGHSLYDVQKILGHSDPAITQRYAHLSSTALQAAANSASVAMKKAGGKVAHGDREAVVETK